MSAETAPLPEREPRRVFIVEDHYTLRRLLTTFINMQADMQVCGSALSGEDALPRLLQDPPDVLMADLSLPGMSGIDLIRAVREHHPDIKCLILSGHQERGYAEQALAVGACAYLVKGNPAEVSESIRRCLHGETIVSAAL